MTSTSSSKVSSSARRIQPLVATALGGSCTVALVYLASLLKEQQQQQEQIEQQQQEHQNFDSTVWNTRKFLPTAFSTGSFTASSITQCDSNAKNINSTKSSKSQQQKPNNNNYYYETMDDFPDFSRFGNKSILKQYLTPQVYNQLKHLKTSNGVTLEHVIQSGVALPWGAASPRGMGVYAGDAECFTTFAPLLDPILQARHEGLRNGYDSSKLENAPIFQQQQQHHSPFVLGGRTSSSRGSNNNDNNTTAARKHRTKHRELLQRQMTNLNPNHVFNKELDPTGEYILYTRMRLSRSLVGYAFPSCITRGKRREVEQLLRDIVQEWKDKPSQYPMVTNGQYISVNQMTNAQHDDLIQRYVLFQDPDAYAISAGFGRDWPDGRGAYYDNIQSPTIVIWCNAEDHFRVVSMRKGGDLLQVFTTLSQVVTTLEESLQRRGQQIATHARYGFLNSSPSSVGTALRASVFVKLVKLGKQPGFDQLLQKLRLESSLRFRDRGRGYTGIFDIANKDRFGHSEVELINTMIKGVGKLIELEKKLERGERVNLNEVE